MHTGSPPWQPAAGTPTPAGHFAIFQVRLRCAVTYLLTCLLAYLLTYLLTYLPTYLLAIFQLLSRIVESAGPPPMPPAQTMPHGLCDVLLACFERDLERRPTTDALYAFPWFEGGGPHARVLWDRGGSSS